MQLGSRIFVAFVFTAIGLAFWATTIQLYLEFAHGVPLWALPGADISLERVAESLIQHENETWFLLLTHYSDLFIFFPVFGTVALIAFYTPACIMVDMYWSTGHVKAKRAIPYARLRFAMGFVAVLLTSLGISYLMLQGTERTIWQLNPTVLANDKGAACTSEQDCQRVRFVDALNNIRIASRERVSLADLKRDCSRDWLVQPPLQPRPERYCPVTTNLKQSAREAEGKWTPDALCCRAQAVFDAAVKSRFDDRANRSATNELQIMLWPFNLFFLLTLLVISALLASRRKRIEEIYPAFSPAIDRGVMIGAIAMVLLPLMHNGFLLTTTLLHGGGGATSFHRIPETFTVAFGLWALLIILSFLHPANKQAEIAARILGVIASVVFALQASTVTDYTIYWFGAGAGAISLATTLVFAIILLGVLWILRRAEAAGDGEEQPEASAPPLPPATAAGTREARTAAEPDWPAA